MGEQAFKYDPHAGFYGNSSFKGKSQPLSAARPLLPSLAWQPLEL
jgi:hypothetical protein